jgi:hypothetical protein
MSTTRESSAAAAAASEGKFEIEDVSTEADEKEDEDLYKPSPTLDYSDLPLPEALRDRKQPIIVPVVLGSAEGGYDHFTEDGKVGFCVARTFESTDELKPLMIYARDNEIPRSFIPIRTHHPFVLTKEAKNLSDADYQQKVIANTFCQLEDESGRIRKGIVPGVARTFVGRKLEDDQNRGSPYERLMTTKNRLAEKAKKLGLKSRPAQKSTNVGKKYSVASCEGNNYDDSWWKAPSVTSIEKKEKKEEKKKTSPLPSKSTGQIKSVAADDSDISTRNYEDTAPSEIKSGAKPKVYAVAEQARKMVDDSLPMGCSSSSTSKYSKNDDKVMIYDKEKWLTEPNKDKAESISVTDQKKMRRDEIKDDLFCLPKQFRKEVDKEEKVCLMQFVSTDVKGRRLDEPIVIFRGCFSTPEALIDYKDLFSKLMTRYHPNHFTTYLDLVRVPMRVLGSPWYNRTLVTNPDESILGGGGAEDDLRLGTTKKEIREMKSVLDNSIVREEERKAGTSSEIATNDPEKLYKDAEIKVAVEEATAAARTRSAVSARIPSKLAASSGSAYKHAPPVKRGIKTDIVTTRPIAKDVSATSPTDDDEIPEFLLAGRSFSGNQLLHKK